MKKETICIQGGYVPGNGEPRQLPIIQSTTFKYDSADEMAKLFDLEADGYFYSRCGNPTCDMVAAKIAELEGGTAAILTGSGMSANFLAFFNIAGAGDHVVASATIYGGTYNILSTTMKRMGLSCTFVDPDCSEEELNAAFQENTKFVFGETIANPALHIFDFEKWAKVAHANNIPLIVDKATEKSEGKIQALYDKIIAESSQKKALWVEAQNSAIDANIKPKSEEAQKNICSYISELNVITSKLN